MKKRKRLLPSTIVALMLMVTIVLSQFTGLALYPNSPKALNETTTVGTIDELKGALASANSGDTIVLAETFPIENVTISSPTVDVTIDAKHLDLVNSGWTINQTGNGNGTLTLNNFVFDGVGPTTISRAFYVATSSKIIINNLYVANRYTYSNGGAIELAFGTANMEINNSTFHNNTVYGSGYTGGAISAKDFSGSLTIQNSVFTENKKLNVSNTSFGNQGGAIYIVQARATAVVQIKDSYFAKNEAIKDAAAATEGRKANADGGAIAFLDIYDGAQISVDGSTFAENVAGADGGAILMQTNGSVNSNLSITNSTFYKNQALGAASYSHNGGAIQFYAAKESTPNNAISNVTIDNNTFYGNSAANRGGALAFAGYSVNRIYGQIRNSLFVDNTSSSFYPNTAGISNNGVGPVNDNGGNVGYDNNVALEEGKIGTGLNVFGTETPALHANNSTVKAGYENTDIVGGKKALAIPTLMILPDSVADNVGVESTLLKDARGFVRSGTAKDSGAVEIGFLAFDANGGVFANELPVTAYDGTRHTISNGDGKVTKVFNVSNITGITTAPTAPAHPDGSPFRGWSLTAGGALLTATALQAELSTVSSGTTLFAVYAISSTVTVRHVDENGATLADSVTLSGYVGDPYTAQAVTIVGYTLKTTPDNATGDYTAENINVTYVYSANPATITVHHVDENGKVLADPVTINGFFGTDYTAPSLDIVGHTLKTTPDNATGLFAVENIEVTFTYSANPATITVHHVDENGKVLADPVTINGFFGTDYTAPSLDIVGHTLKTTPDNATGLFAVENIEVTFTYSANPATVTVHHVDENGKVLADPVTINGFFGTDYTAPSLDIVGHTLKTTPDNATGLFAVENIEVTFTYSANPATITVHHVDENGKVLADPVTINGFFGTDYTAPSLDIVGHTLKTTPDNATGTFSVENTDVTYTYEKVEEPTTEEPTTQEPTTEEPTSEKPTIGEPTTSKPTTEPTTNGKRTDTPNTGDKGITFTLATFALTAVVIGIMSAKKRKEENN